MTNQAPALDTDFRAYTTTLRGEVDGALDRNSHFGEGCPPLLEEAIRHSLLAPAKRLRPMLVLMAAEACGVARQVAMGAACAVEMVHTYSLIHDDLPAMDDDDLRRGLPTCHAKYGEATAILAGDALLACAFEILAREIRPPATAGRCCLELARAAGPCQLVGGQADDLASEHTDGDLARLEAIHRRKTGALFVVSLRLGGIAASADERRLQQLTEYGCALGLAFQIVDDLLDHEGDAQTLGKRSHKDEARGKLTFPRLLGVEESRRRATDLVHHATEVIHDLRPHSQGLEGLARYVLERTN